MSKVTRLFDLAANVGEHRISVLMIIILVGPILAEAVLLEDLRLITLIAALVIILLVTVCMVCSSIGVLRRLIQIIYQDGIARPRDLMLVGSTYFSLIIGFATIYCLGGMITGGESFYFSYPRSYFHIVDCIYVSGITITSVGFGDVVPAYWFSKTLVVIEALSGWWLSATVLGLFVGSILNSRQQEREALWFQDVQKVYFDALNRFSAAINSMQTLTDDEIKSLEKSLLQNIANIVKLQYHPVPSAKVSANWMQLYTGADAPPDAVVLAQQYVAPTMRNEAAMRALWGILVLREWDERPEFMPDNGQLAIPVYDPDDPEQMRYQLFGGPTAVASTNGYDVVSDVREIDYINQDVSVREHFVRYFTEHQDELKSFASVRVDFDGEDTDTLGAINIQSSEANLCGTTSTEQSLIVNMIRPFARYLAALQANRARIQTERIHGQD
jgi:hypothetical protein